MCLVAEGVILLDFFCLFAQFGSIHVHIYHICRVELPTYVHTHVPVMARSDYITDGNVTFGAMYHSRK